MVAIRPTAVQGTESQKFVVTKRFSGDGYDFVIGDIIVAKKAWVHKIPAFVDQKLISPYISAEDSEKTPVNLVDKTDEVEAVSEDPKEPEKEEVTQKTDEGSKDETEVDQSEVDQLAASLLK